MPLALAVHCNCTANLLLQPDPMRAAAASQTLTEGCCAEDKLGTATLEAQL